jgi:hypothetical protein
MLGCGDGHLDDPPVAQRQAVLGQTLLIAK